MGKMPESSALFSLASLLEFEQNRVQREAEERLRLLEEERARAQVAEQQRRDEERRHLRETREREAAERRRADEEAARLQGIRDAELEKLRLEAKHRVGLEMAERRREEALPWVTRERTKPPRRLPWTLVAASIASIGVAGALALHDVSVRGAAALEAAERRVAARYAETLALYRSRTAKSGADVERLKAELEALERERLERTGKPSPKAPNLGPRPRPAATPKPGPRPKQEPTPAVTCHPHDPMCG